MGKGIGGDYPLQLIRSADQDRDVVPHLVLDRLLDLLLHGRDIVAGGGEEGVATLEVGGNVGVPEGGNGDSKALALDQLAKAASGFMPTRALDRAEQADMVRYAVAALGERQRMALLLAKFEGMSYQDIAQTMGLSVQAIKSLLSRARVNLKEILTPYVEQGTRLDEAEPPQSEMKD